MSQFQSPPTLEQYPGYFPAAKPPFWSRAKVGAVAGAAGLIVGIAVSAASGSEPASDRPAPAAKAPAKVEIQASIDDAVAAAEERFNQKLGNAHERAEQRLTVVRERAATTQRQAVARAVAKVRATDQEKLRQAVAAARAQARAQAVKAQSQAAAAPSTSSSGSGGTDPRFNYCYEANDAGYGPYFRGQDPEYNWYEDADNDGEVCE